MSFLINGTQIKIDDTHSVSDKISSADSHASNTSNPHSTTASQVGAEPANANIQNHIASTSNPHSTTASQVGLGNVTNESKATMFDSPTFTGTPVAPTAAVGTNTSQIATTAFVNSSLVEFLNSPTYSGTLSTSWSGSQAPFSQAVTVMGIASTDEPILDVVMSGTYATDELRNTEWAYIYYAVTATDQITFYARQKPTVSLPFIAKVI